MNDKIDFVVTWVDGNDEAWRKRKEAFTSAGSTYAVGVNRYRDWGLMRYWFRGVEKFAPWVNKVFFVTCGQTPPWLNTEHPKLKLVSHEEYMPASALPTFNSRAIEMGIHRLEGLSEQFVLFNDDMFLIDHVEPTLFFRDGLPCDYAVLDEITPTDEFWHVIVNDMILINQNFSKRKCLRENPGKWYSLKDVRSTRRTVRLSRPWEKFSGMRDFHIALPYLKSEFEAMWKRFPEQLNATVHRRFRSNEDINHWLIRYWRLASGQFYPLSQRYGIYKGMTGENTSRIADIVSGQKKKEICINDTYQGEEVEKIQRMLQKAFDSILPEPSSFEKDIL